MWLWLSLTALLCWSGSDLFSKIGCRDGSDRYSHLKMVIAVGVETSSSMLFRLLPITGIRMVWWMLISLRM